MKKIITITALLSLSACSTLTTNFPAQSAKVVELTQKGLGQYCKRVPLNDRVALRTAINTPEQGGVVWCTADERLALLGK